MEKETPMMAQFRTIKEQYPDAMLLFRCGDFYETYCEDAVQASKILNITLTHRSNGAAGAAPIDMAGFPFHALDTYLPKLVRYGYRVAICDQLEDPKLTKTLVKRGVTELVTPGVSYSDTTLTQKENTFLAALHFPKQSTIALRAHHPQSTIHHPQSTIGLSLLDISTGEFLVAEGDSAYIDKLLTNFSPKEVLFFRDRKADFTNLFGDKYFTFLLDDWIFTTQAANDRLLKQFGTSSLKGFGVDNLPSAVIAAGAILYYLDMTQHLQTAHIRHLSRIEEERFVWLDKFTVRNLELFDGPTADSKSLYSILDSTLTPMGARLLRRWLSFPLKDVQSIEERQAMVKLFTDLPELMNAVRESLSPIGDMERLVSKISTGRIGPRDLRHLAFALHCVEDIQNLFNNLEEQPASPDAIGAAIESRRNSGAPADGTVGLGATPEAAVSEGLLSQRTNILAVLSICKEERDLIERTLTLDPPIAQGRPDTIAHGVDADLDHYRDLRSGGKNYLLEIQQREIEATGIQSLKIGFNSVFGYYLEVRNTYKDQVPETWIRKQTLVNAERYITPELKQYEEQIVAAESQIEIIESRIYADLLQSLLPVVNDLQADAFILAQLDCLASFATVAIAHNYVCPEVNDSLILDIKQGRHPVIEQQLPFGSQYVPNDIYVDNNSQQILIITGPNMAGKSALLRQTALIVLMAQIGSFVPAQSAKLGIVDKVFTRVGASDNISQGESTFMVEMTEASSILNNLSERSLILFDELGRGTSTYDGISIAWAIVEYIHNHPGHAKTLFATHYHELNEMEALFERIRNFNVSVKEVDGKVLFMRKLVRGGSEHSFGIHVAKLAGMPPSIIDRANHILKDLEMNSNKESLSANAESVPSAQNGSGPTGGLSAEGSLSAAGSLSVEDGLSASKASGLSAKRSFSPQGGLQLSLFALNDPVLEQIRDEVTAMDINNLTPLEALNKLNEIKHLVGQ